MTYKLIMARKAEQDRDETFEWYRKNYSEAFAVRWYVTISKAIESLAADPLRCNVARENTHFPFKLQELLFGRSKQNRHRILFTVEGDAVHVLHIRHSAQDEIRASDI